MSTPADTLVYLHLGYLRRGPQGAEAAFPHPIDRPFDRPGQNHLQWNLPVKSWQRRTRTALLLNREIITDVIGGALSSNVTGTTPAPPVGGYIPTEVSSKGLVTLPAIHDRHLSHSRRVLR